jgi:protein SCO1/2
MLKAIDAGSEVTAASTEYAHSLVDQRGHPVDELCFLGRTSLAVFGMANCRRTGRILNALSDALDQFDLPESTVQGVFITIDPAHDTPSVMQRFLAKESPRSRGITGSREHIHTVLRAWVSARAWDRDDRNADRGHSDYVYVVDPDGKVVERWPASMDVEEIVLRLGRLV